MGEKHETTRGNWHLSNHPSHSTIRRDFGAWFPTQKVFQILQLTQMDFLQNGVQPQQLSFTKPTNQPTKRKNPNGWSWKIVGLPGFSKFSQVVRARWVFASMKWLGNSKGVVGWPPRNCKGHGGLNHLGIFNLKASQNFQTLDIRKLECHSWHLLLHELVPRWVARLRFGSIMRS